MHNLAIEHVDDCVKDGDVCSGKYQFWDQRQRLTTRAVQVVPVTSRDKAENLQPLIIKRYKYLDLTSDHSIANSVHP